MAVAEFFNQVSEQVDAGQVAGMNAVYQFNITGNESGEWNVKIADGSVEVAEGTADSPSITLTMDSSDFSDLVAGNLNGQTAFLTGKLKIQGDMTLAMKLQSIFNLG